MFFRRLLAPLMMACALLCGARGFAQTQTAPPKAAKSEAAKSDAAKSAAAKPAAASRNRSSRRPQ